MSDALAAELANGKALAEALVEHMYAMGCASRVEREVTHVDPGGMRLWRVTVELVAGMEEPKLPPDDRVELPR